MKKNYQAVHIIFYQHSHMKHRKLHFQHGHHMLRPESNTTDTTHTGPVWSFKWGPVGQCFGFFTEKNLSIFRFWEKKAELWKNITNEVFVFSTKHCCRAQRDWCSDSGRGVDSQTVLTIVCVGFVIRVWTVLLNTLARFYNRRVELVCWRVTKMLTDSVCVVLVRVQELSCC